MLSIIGLPTILHFWPANNSLQLSHLFHFSSLFLVVDDELCMFCSTKKKQYCILYNYVLIMEQKWNHLWSDVNYCFHATKQRIKWNSKTLAVDGELLPPPSGSLPLKSRPSPNSFSLLTVKDKKKAAFREHTLKHRRTLAKGEHRVTSQPVCSHHTRWY